MAYADYTFYTEQYFGTALSEADFLRLSTKASSFLDYYTKGKSKENAELEALKMACCELAEQYQMIELAKNAAVKSLSATGENGELQSQTVGSYSVTYRSAGDSAANAYSASQEFNKELAAIAQRHLAGTGLLYRGGR